MKKVCLEWNINCDNDSKNGYKDDHEVRTDHYKLDNGKYKAVYDCEFCDYFATEITDELNVINWDEITEDQWKTIQGDK